ncbi:hypothetical protein [Halobiforma nitratireducens]|uniref:Uncharacterized protein n=1 Tax=Halobiforma nitratireducens JCM 10879 TaxID=1227454 RepID=M0MN97_9EURY|nr:hypothetical protein [Halobiforma nitratireducens]EMA47162.1 hypothetical protein C446_00565 [Halobiforma nitratireducens JCM 10879]
MTSIRDLLAEAVGVREVVRVRRSVGDDDRTAGRLFVEHPRDESPLNIAIVEGLDRLEDGEVDRPSGTAELEVEILDRTVDGRAAGRLVDIHWIDGG